MANQGLLFIPDISGFSRFVNQTEIDHSLMIIQELLETLINANEIGLEVSEVEGDAILFYKYGDAPSLEELYRQVERMFCSFHSSLRAYEMRKYCQCNACLAAKDLTLKVISHYGEFTGYNVKSFNKLIGRDVIVAHELLKNDIDEHEYWLVTDTLAPAGRPEVPAEWMQWMAGAKQTQGGEVPFQYAQLGRLKDELPADRLPTVDLGRFQRAFQLTREYDVDIITLFHTAGDFAHRARWREGIARVEEVDHLLPRVGMRCRCVMDDGSIVRYVSSYYAFTDARIEFTESEEPSGRITRYVLEPIDEERSRLTVEYFLAGGWADTLLFRTLKQGVAERQMARSLERLAPAALEVRDEEARSAAERASR